MKVVSSLYFHLHQYRIMVTAQVQVGRVVAVSPDAGGMENVVDAQQAFEVTVGVHVATAAGSEAIFEDVA